MKKSFFFAALLLLSLSLFGQSNKSALRLRLSDGTQLKVELNNRNFNKIGRALIIDAIPGKRTHIKVYRFRPYADGRGGKAELVYSGTIKLKKGASYDAIVDVRNRKLRMKEVSSFNNVPQQEPPKLFKPQIIQESQDIQTQAIPNAKNANIAHLSMQLQTINKAMETADTDSEKLVIAQKYIGNQISTADLSEILNWFFFDDTKLQFVKSVYSKVSDKNNAASLSNTFTSESSKKELSQFLKKQ